MTTKSASERAYSSGFYWRHRDDLMYYRYIKKVTDYIKIDDATIIDVGSGNTPYLEWFDWASHRVSVDIKIPYQSEQVIGLKADILKEKFDRQFDFCLCLQVLEHLEEPIPFMRRLFEIGKIVIISVPFKWPRGAVKWHPQDPVDRPKLRRWTDMDPDYEVLVAEPMKVRCHERLIAVYDPLKTSAALQALVSKR